MHELSDIPANTPARTDDPPLDFIGPHVAWPGGDESPIYLRSLLLGRLDDAGLADQVAPDESLTVPERRVIEWLASRGYLAVRVVADLIARAYANGVAASWVRRDKLQRDLHDLYLEVGDLADTWHQRADDLDDDRGHYPARTPQPPDGERSEALRDCAEQMTSLITRHMLRCSR